LDIITLHVNATNKSLNPHTICQLFHREKPLTGNGDRWYTNWIERRIQTPTGVNFVEAYIINCTGRRYLYAKTHMLM